MLSLIYPSVCLHCERSFERPRHRRTVLNSEALLGYLCPHCHRQYLRGLPPDDEEILLRLRSAGEFENITSGLAYRTFHEESSVRSLVQNFKYHSMRRLGIYCGGTVSEDAQFSLPTVDLFIPTPLHRVRHNWRGYNQAEMIALGLRGSPAIPILRPPMIYRTRQTEAQVTLTSEERLQNVRDVFRLSEQGRAAVRGKSVLLIDDVMTTGATLGNLAEAVSEGEPSEIHCFALAAAGFGA